MVRTIEFSALALIIAGILAACSYALLWMRYISGSPRITHDYLAEFNGPLLNMAEKDRAWPLYEEAFELALNSSRAQELEELQPWDAAWPTAKEFASQARDYLCLVREASRRPHLGRRIESERDVDGAERSAPKGDRHSSPGEGSTLPLVRIIQSHLASLRYAGATLRLDARVALDEGYAERAADDIECAFALAKQVLGLPTLISEPVGIAIVDRTVRLLEEIAYEQPHVFSGEQWTRIAHRLASVREGGPFRLTTLRLERAVIDDLVQRTYSNDGAGNGFFVATPAQTDELLDGYPAAGTLFQRGTSDDSRQKLRLFFPILSFLAPDRRDVGRRLEQLFSLQSRELDLPLWERDESSVYDELRQMNQGAWARIRSWPIYLLFPNLSRGAFVADVTTQRRDAALVAIALELYRRETGAYPATLRELTPKWLPAVPIDRYDGQLLKYRLIDGQPVVYSVGVDRDDDGGRLPAARQDSPAPNRYAHEWISPTALRTARNANQPLPDGDWILWPPVER
jgi:hypothetical protein